MVFLDHTRPARSDAFQLAARIATSVAGAARLGLRLLILVYDDAAYGAEVHHFGPQGHPVDLVRFPDADLAGLARAAGGDGVTVRSLDDLAAVERWLAAPEGPLLVDAKVDPGICGEWLEEAFRAG